MTTDFRALCAELAKQLEGWQCYASPDGPNAEVLARAHAALAQPEPVGPTDEEIDALEAQRETEKAVIEDIYAKLDRLKVQHESNWARIVKLEAAADHFPDAKKMVAPAGGLVERVMVAGGIGLEENARAAIREVADRIEETGWQGWADVARWLRQVIADEQQESDRG
jgi:hypothetical protein